jgi:putative transposase
MPRRSRAIVAGYCYHVINRSNDKARIFHDSGDYAAFLGLIADAQRHRPVALLAACLMPNHVHFVLQPSRASDVALWTHWLFTTHAGRHHRKYATSGHIWQGRFKASAIQQDQNLLMVMRYVERNAMRAQLVSRAEEWRWGSLNWRIYGHPLLVPNDPPVPLPSDWTELVNEGHTEAELASIRSSVNRQSPFGAEDWVKRTAAELGVGHSINPRGRPRKKAPPNLQEQMF